MNIVLYQPEIPQNTGNIVRTCAAAGAGLHIIKPMGFVWDDRKLKRAGLDYWKDLDIRFYDSWENFLAEVPNKANLWLLSTKGDRFYSEVRFQQEDYLVFGQETAGVPSEIHEQLPGLRIPMREGLRSLNVANAAALVLYEAYRQLGFRGLE